MFFKLNKFYILLVFLLPSLSYSIQLGDVTSHGFVSQGFISSSHNNFLGESSNGSFDFGQAAVNFSYPINNRMVFSTQLISRNYGNNKLNNEDLALDYGLINLNLVSGYENELKIKFGQVKTPMGLYGHVRDIPSVYSGAILPQTMYAEWSRSSMLRSRGGLIKYEHRAPAGNISFEYLNGKMEYPENSYYAYNYLNGYRYPVEAPNPDVWVARLFYRSPSDLFFFGLTKVKINEVLISDFYSEEFLYDFYRVNTGEMDARFYSFGMNYGMFAFTTEYLRVQKNTHSALNATSLVDSSLDIDAKYYSELVSDSYYAQIEAKFENDICLFYRYEHKYINTGLGKSVTGNFSEINVIGGSWHIDQNFILKAEYHNIDGGYGDMLDPADNPNKHSDGVDRYWSMGIVQLIYSF